MTTKGRVTDKSSARKSKHRGKHHVEVLGPTTDYVFEYIGGTRVISRNKEARRPDQLLAAARGVTAVAATPLKASKVRVFVDDGDDGGGGGEGDDRDRSRGGLATP